MAFESTVKIGLEVTGEQMIKQAFSGVAKEIQGMSGLVGQLDKVLQAYEKQQSKTAKKEQELAQTKENVNSILAKQKDILKFLTEGYTRGQAGLLEYAKTAGATAKELQALGKILDDQRKVMGKNPFDDSTGALKKLKKETEDNVRVLKELKSANGLTEGSIRELIRAEEALKVSMTQAGVKGKERRQALADLRKEFKDLALAAQTSGAAIEQYNADIEQSIKDAAQAEKNGLTMMDQAVQQFKKNQEEKTRALELESKKRIDAMMREAQKQAQIANQTQGIRSQADMVRGGASPEVAAKVTTLKSQGLDDSQINARLYAEQELADAIAARSKQEQAAAGISKALNTINANNVKLTQDTANKEKILTLAKQEKISVTQAEFIVTQRLLGVREQEIRANLKAAQALKEYEASTKKATVSLTGFGGVIRQILPTVGALGLGSVLTQTAVAFIRTADTMSLLKSRMKLVLDETQNFDQVYSNLVQTSINNRASLTDTVTLFNRLVPALKANGVEAGAATTVIDSFQKTLLISGATVRETSSAMLQLSQAFAAGRLNGDEFRSISEAAPEFLRTFSEATGVAAGSLKELAADGKLTTEVLVAAMVVMNDELTRTAAGIDITFGQSVQVLGTRLSVLVDVINETTGFTKSLAEATFNVSETVRVFTDTISANKELVSSVVSVLGDAVTVLGATALAYGAIKLAIIAAAPFVSLFNVAMGAYGAAAGTAALGAGAATTATTALGTAVKGLLTSTGIGALAVILGMAGVALAEYVFSSDDAAKASEKVKEKTAEETAAIEKAKVVLEKFGITYSAAAGAAGVYAKKTQELTDSYIKQKVSAEGLYLIEKNLLELERAKLVIKAGSIAQSESDIEKRNKAIEGVASEIKAINDLLGIMKLTEEERKRVESARASSKVNKQEEKEIEKISKAVQGLQDKYISYGGTITDIERVESQIVAALKSGKISAKEYTKAIVDLAAVREASKDQEYAKAQAAAAIEMNKVLDATDDQTKAYKDQVAEIEEQILKINKQKDALLALEIAKIDEAIATKQQTIASISYGDANDELIAKYREQIKELEKLKDAKGRLAQAEKDAEFNKELEKIFEDVGEIFGEAIFNGGADSVKKLGQNIKNYFKSLVVRLAIEPDMKSVGKQLNNLARGKEVDLGSLGSSLQGLSAGAVGGSTGSLLNLALKTQTAQNAVFSGGLQLADAFGASTQASLDFANALSGPNGLASYAGSIAQVLSGDIKGGAFSAAGTYAGQAIGASFGGPIGATIGGAIGAAIGNTVGKLFGGGGKISNQSLSPETLKPITDATTQGYQNILKALGGTGSAQFGISGGTGRQGANPFFVLDASSNGQNIFRSNQTAEGQADGLFLSGEIALNDANIADQTTRAIVTALKLSDFADNIDAVFEAVNPFTDSLEKLNVALQDAQLLKTINDEFPKLGGALATLAGQSIETVKTFVLLAGGVENLTALQGNYIQSIYSEEDKLARASNNLKTAFNALGVSIPRNASEFRNLVEAQDLSTTSGQATYLSLLQLSGAFVEVTSRIKEETQARNSLVSSISSSISEVSANINALTSGLISSADDIFSSFVLNMLSASEKIRSVGEELRSSTDAGAQLQLQTQLKDAIIARYELEQELLGGVASSIQDLFSEIDNERTAVRAAVSEITGNAAFVMSSSEIRDGIVEAARLGALPSTSGIDSANNRISEVTSGISALNDNLSAQLAQRTIEQAQLQAKRTSLGFQVDVAKRAVELFNQNNRVNSAFATNSAGGLATASFDQATLKAALDYAYITYNIGDEASVTALRNQLNQRTTFEGLFGETITGAINSANADIVNAQAAVVQAEAAVSKTDAKIAATTASLASAQNTLTQAERDRIVAQEEFAKEIQTFVIDAGKAVSRLSRLREETIRYYEVQKQLADLLNTTATGLRTTVSNVRFSDLNSLDQLGVLETQFSTLFSQASGANGETLAALGNNLNSLIDPLLQKAAEVYASGPEFQRIKELVLGQALTIAEKLESLAPKNYQEESLAILDTIDTTLSIIEQNTKSAETLIVDAIGASSVKTVDALRAVVAAITGEPIPAFATGGLVRGAGTGTSDSITARLSNGEYVMPASTVNQFGVPLMNSIRSGNIPVLSSGSSSDNSELITEIKALRRDVRDTGNLSIKIVTEDGRVMMEQTITEIKERSRKGELVVYSKGVK